MSPTILVVGATGNTGRGVVETLPRLIAHTTLSSYRVLALTRAADGGTARQIAMLPGIEILEQNWVEITEDWLREREVSRVFIASHSEPTQFTDESQFLVNALSAGVKYVVRISTMAANVRPNFRAYYPRSHWAIEKMLEQPEFHTMHWTSLQPNAFAPMLLAPTAQFIKHTLTTGRQSPMSLIIDADTPTGLVDPHDVGILAAHLLAQEDTSPHQAARYIVNGPEDITGREVEKLAEQYIGARIKDVQYQDLSFIDKMAKTSKHSQNLMMSIKHTPVASWNGEARAETTSEEVFGLFAPRSTVADILKGLVQV